MHIQRTRRRIAQEQRLTHYDELEARSTMSRLQLAVDDGEHTDASGAALVWRQAARLAGRLHCQARAIADELSTADERAHDSRLRHRGRGRARRAVRP